MIPLSVRIDSARASTNITRQLRDLSFRSVVPGGFASATFSLDRPLNVRQADLVAFAAVTVFDTRTARVVWEGRLEDPGRGAGSDGLVWELAAGGSSTHSRDRTFAYVAIDTSLERWERSTGFSDKTADASMGERDDDTPSLLLRAQDNVSTPIGWTSDMRYNQLRRTGQSIGRIEALVVNGADLPAWKNDILTRQDGGALSLVRRFEFTTNNKFMSGSLGGSNPVPSGHNVAHIRIQRTFSDSLGSASTWGEWTNIVVQAARKNADGTDITSGYGSSVKAHEIINDLLGRYLEKYDGTNASIATNAFDIEQAAWADGVTSADIFDDLMALEPAYYWAAWESNDGKYRFEWKPWPTTVRYEADISGGFDSPGSSEGLYDAVTVRWRTPNGHPRTVRRTQTVKVLDDAELTREAFLDLGDEVGSLSQAQQAGDEYLAEHMQPPNRGTLTVAGPIRDLIDGCSVMPWQIKPGELIRVRGIAPSLDTLNASDRDGVTVFKVASVDFSTQDAAATLELDAHTRTEARAIAELQRRRITRRR